MVSSTKKEFTSCWRRNAKDNLSVTEGASEKEKKPTAGVQGRELQARRWQVWTLHREKVRCVPGVEELGGQHKAEMNRSGPCQASPAVGKHTWTVR